MGYKNCEECGGSGNTHCTSCGGVGVDGFGKQCMRCHGTGRVKCFRCGGHGRMTNYDGPSGGMSAGGGGCFKAIKNLVTAIIVIGFIIFLLVGVLEC